MLQLHHQKLYQLALLGREKIGRPSKNKRETTTQRVVPHAQPTRRTDDRRLLCYAPKDGNGSGSDRVESPCTQNRNPKSKPEPEPETDSGGNPSPKPNPRIPETRMDTRNPRINIHIFTCINKRQQIINIFMSQLSINLIV